MLLRDRLPAYISWERFEANQKRLAANRARHAAPGAPRQGPSLLGGLLRCGRCGRRMPVRYSGPKGRHWYGCTRGVSDYAEPLCQSLAGPPLDELVARQLLAAVEPEALEASLAAVADLERERAELARQWQLRRERARYEAERAHRQDQACEPEDRLVGRELERRWEEALRQQRELEEGFERWQRSVPCRLSAADQGAIRALADDLPGVWSAETTTPADRQRVARLLLEQVRVVVDKESERVDGELHWAGGLVGRAELSRPVSRYDRRAEYPRLVERLRQMSAEGLSGAQTAERLNEEGSRPPQRTERFSREMVLRLLGQLELTRRARHGSDRGLGADEYRPGGLARRLGVKRDTVRRWLRVGWLSVRRDEDGHHVIWADGAELERLPELMRLPRTWENKARLAELKKPRPFQQAGGDQLVGMRILGDEDAQRATRLGSRRPFVRGQSRIFPRAG